MSDAKASYRQILKSTSIVGGATVASLIFGLVRSKAIALLAGPTGIGMFGVLNTLFNTGNAIAGLNLWASGVRQVGSTPPSSPERARAETGLWLFAWLAAIIGGFAFWLFERLYYIPNTPVLAGIPSFPWIAIAVALTTLNSAQLIILQVNSRIAAVASIRVFSSLFSSTLSILAVYLLGTTGLYIAVLTVPVSSILFSLVYGRNVPKAPWQKIGDWVFSEWRTLVAMGTGLTIANLTSNASQLMLRSLIAARGGLPAAGLFQAAWTLSNVNLTVVLSAMVVDYYPRLTAQARSPKALATIMNQQIHVGLLLLGPALTLAIGMAPLIVSLLYSSSFIAAAPVLQWQTIGDVFKLPVWAIGFVLLALNSTKGYVVTGLSFDISIIVSVYLLYPLLGIESTGIGYVLSQMLALAVSMILIRRHGIQIDGRNLLWIGLLTVTLTTLTILSTRSTSLGMIGSTAASLGVATMSWREARRMDLGLPIRLQRLLRLDDPREQQ